MLICDLDEGKIWSRFKILQGFKIKIHTKHFTKQMSFLINEIAYTHI